MVMIPLDTPGNRRGAFAPKQKTPLPVDAQFDPLKLMVLPEKTPRIYDRCVKGLESGVLTEVEFALHHLVVISDERGDKFRFCDFPGLAESLLEASWEITYLIHGVSFEVTYDPIPVDEPRINLLDGCCGTPRLAQKISQLPVLLSEESSAFPALEPEGLARYKRIVLEASLVLHNMAMLEDNAVFLSEMPLFKDYVTYILHLPLISRAAASQFNEVFNYALETIEVVCPYWRFSADDLLIPALLECVRSSDRTHVISAMRILVLWAIERPNEASAETSANSRSGKKEYGHVSHEILRAVDAYTLLEQDRELLSATLDFLYQFTVSEDNVSQLINSLSPLAPGLVRRLVSLLLYDSDEAVDARLDREEIRAMPPPDVPEAPPSLHAELIRLNEPERCKAWLKSCFVEDEGCEITQLALWHAYQRTFQLPQPMVQTTPTTTTTTTPGTPTPMTPAPQQAPTLQAADFINTVNATFFAAEAQVVQSANGEPPKFIIRGIRPLEEPRDLRGCAYVRCRWVVPMAMPTPTPPGPIAGPVSVRGVNSGYIPRCTKSFRDAEQLKEHILSSHLGLEKESSQQTAEDQGAKEPQWRIPSSLNQQTAQSSSNSLACRWSGCRDFVDHYHAPAAFASQTPAQSGQEPMDVDSPSQAPPSQPSVSSIVNHISTAHLPSPPSSSSSSSSHPNPASTPVQTAAAAAAPAPPPPIPPRPLLQIRLQRVFDYYPTPADEKSEPLGVAYKALLVLRNIMRNLPPGLAPAPPSSSVSAAAPAPAPAGSVVVNDKRHSSYTSSSSPSFPAAVALASRGESWSHALFFSHRTRLLETADFNPVLRGEIFALVDDIRSD